MKHKLDDIEKKVDYKVPDGYFEKLPLKIQQRIDAEKSKETVFSFPTWSYAVAASVIVLITFVFLMNDPKPAVETMLAEISEDALIAYLEEIEVDEYDIASAIPEDAEILPFEEVELLQDLDLGDESFDSILLEYNLDEESIEI